MEPRRGILVRDVRVEGATLGQATLVWIVGTPADGLVPIEAAGEGRHAIARDAVLPCPVAAPPLAELRRLDSCFGKSDEHFALLHESARWWFRILRCREHGRLFLEDSRGGIASYTRTILVDESLDRDDYVGIWRHYHAMADDWLNYLGIAR